MRCGGWDWCALIPTGRIVRLEANPGGKASIPAFDPPEAASTIADRLGRRVAESSLPFGDPSIALTVGMGAASLLDGDESAESVVFRADGALYRAKAGGRNRLELAPQAEAA